MFFSGWLRFKRLWVRSWSCRLTWSKSNWPPPAVRSPLLPVYKLSVARQGLNCNYTSLSHFHNAPLKSMHKMHAAVSVSLRRPLHLSLWTSEAGEAGEARPQRSHVQGQLTRVQESIVLYMYYSFVNTWMFLVRLTLACLPLWLSKQMATLQRQGLLKVSSHWLVYPGTACCSGGMTDWVFSFDCAKPFETPLAVI